ncbi:MFS transporter [Actinosynnema sp. NPDC047251]|uniref:Transmembrane efflux protein n=1 Tax=Saccharothrix espanaensis (strain ATCC 51144 / DSM 44229 / JCM 9112 / NBRC 15066 / NRRL 15764) TaxID=1179773 RepID=K0K1P7_SACES|nr:MFS transporter [Saccharothrix espanaensis]CCH32266.1 Transmembrane efflux protein [Saccharothrix espanaensis DSM 44229]
MGSEVTPVPESGHPRRRPALAALCLALVVTTIDNTVLNTALPALAEALPASTADLQWITNAYTLVFAATLITAGSLGARFGHRRALVGGLAVLAVASAAAALSGSAGHLVAFRAVMGLGAAFVMPATLSVIVALFGPGERGRAIATWSATAGIGVVAGPVTGGLLLDHFAWGSVFWITVPLVALALTAILLLVPALPGHRTGRLDVPGLLLSATGLAALVDVVVQGPERGWLTTTTAVEAGAAVVLLAAFVRWELRTAHPMVDVRLFADRAFSVAGGVLGITFFALFGVLFGYTQYLQLVHGFSPFEAGLGALPFALSMAATAGTSDRCTARFGPRTTIAAGLAGMAAGLGGLSLITVGTPFAVLALTMGVVGAGMGLVMAPASTVTVAAVPRVKSPMASSVNSVVRELGGALGIAVVGTVVSASYRARLATTLPDTPSLAVEDLTSAHRFAAELPPGPADRLVAAADEAFTAAMNHGTRLCAVAALLGAVAALVWLRQRPRVEQSAVH